MSEPGWRSEVRDTYADLVGDGVYTTGFRHSDADRDLVRTLLAPIVGALGPDDAVLEAGCGVGEWLEMVVGLTAPGTPPTICGFDLTPEMVEVARRRLAPAWPAVRLRTGDLLDPAAYETPGSRGFGLVYAFDVLQQLPRDAQLRGLLAMYAAVAPGGHLVLFDQDAASAAGTRMGLKKAITRYLRIPLVPRFYLVARYPRAVGLVRALTELGAAVELVRPGSGARFALVATRAG